MTIKKQDLAVPFPVPLLGEPYVSVGCPVIAAATGLTIHVSCAIDDVTDTTDVKIGSPRLRRACLRALRAAGISGTVSFSFPMPLPFSGPPKWAGAEADMLSVAASLYLAGSEAVEPIAPSLLKGADDRTFIDLLRAMTSLSGGFVAGRRGEGLVSIDGNVDAALHATLVRRRRSVRPILGRFSAAYPELADPFWHIVGHLVLQGIDAIRAGDAPMLGRLMTLESRLSLAVGLSDERDLLRLSRSMPSLGCKPVRGDGLSGGLHLIGPGMPHPPGRPILNFTQVGITHDG